jgi:hypothetical protein
MRNNRSEGTPERPSSAAPAAAGVPLPDKDQWGNRSPLMNGAMMQKAPKVTFRTRFWRALGFNAGFDPGLLDFRYAELDGYAESSMMIETRVYFTMGDRLRLLISGCLRVETCTRTDVVVMAHRQKSMSRVTVMSPGFVKPAPRVRWRAFLLMVALLPLFGCAVIGNPFETGEQIAARESAEDAGYCRSYGIQYGTEDFVRCIEGRQQLRRQDELIIALRNSYATPLPGRRVCAIYHWDRTYAELDCR